MESKVFYDFKLMGNDYNPVVMWFWNDIITKKEIKFQLGEFKKMGIYEYFIHPMFGLRTEYMSDSFMELVAYSVEVAKELGMKFWIYDEYNWPSGTCGGKLLEEYPWTRGKLLRRYQQAVGSFQTLEHVANGRFYKAFVENIDGGSVEFIDFTKKVKVVGDGETSKVTFFNDSMNVTVFDLYYIEYQDTPLASSHWAKGLNEVHGYIDTFNKKAVRKFIEMTHERYKLYIGKEFGKTVKGVFTDETTMCAVGDIIKPGGVVFNECTPKEFKERYGYDIGDKINYLFFPSVTDEQRKVRNDFWNLVTDLYATNFIKQMSDWCVANKLKFTGHFGGEEHLQWSLYETGDMQLALTHLHQPGMDSILSSKFIENSNFNNAGKMVSSVAKFCGRERILCETYTMSDWDTHLDLMRRIANRVVTMGGNFIQYMGAYYSLNGNRKEQPVGYPPSHSYNNPLSKYYKIFGDYVGAMQYLSAKTHPAGKVLLVAPLTQVKQMIDLAYSQYEPQSPANRVDNLYEHIITALLEEHIEFDIVSEFMLKDFTDKSGRVSINGFRYDIVIFPEVENYDKKIADFTALLAKCPSTRAVFINGFLENGIDGAKAAFKAEKLKKVRAAARASELYKYDGADVWLYKKDEPSVLDLRMQLIPLCGLDHVTLGIETKGKVYTSLRENDDYTLVFIDNDENAPVKVTFDAKNGMKVLSPVTRKERPVAIANGKATVTLNQYELIAVVFKKNSNEEPKAVAKELSEWNAAGKKAASEITLDKFGFDFEKNVFVCGFEYKFDKNGGGFRPAVNDTMFGDRDRIVMGDRYTAKSTFELKGYKGKIELFTETECIRRITLNGKELKVSANCRLWGPENCLLDVTDLVKEGKNEVVIEGIIPAYRSFHTVPNTMLFGKFAIDKNNAIIPVGDVKYGDFTEQGFPRMTGDACYSYKFTAEAGKRAFLFLDTDDAYTVILNGKEICKKLWRPCVCELKGVKEGENDLTVVTTTPYGNLMRVKTKSGLLSPAKIKFF